MSKWRGFLNGLGVIILMLGLGSFMGYIWWKLDWAHRQAETLCNEAMIGAKFEGMEARATALGLRVVKVPPGLSPGSMLAHEGFGPGRWGCFIYYDEKGVILSKQLSEPS